MLILILCRLTSNSEAYPLLLQHELCKRPVLQIA